MANILLIETATEICSIGISDKYNILANISAENEYSHSESITLLIKDCLKQANLTFSDLDAVAISKGPGSYTALRVGTSTAKGICYAMNIPLIAVDTLTSLAFAASQLSNAENMLFCPMIDARRMEIYAALFDQNLNCVSSQKSMIIDENSLQDYFEKQQNIIFVGNGAEKCKAVLSSSFAKFETIVCDAKHLAPLAQKAFEEQNFEDTAYYVPTYGKAPNITQPKKKL